MAIIPVGRRSIFGAAERKKRPNEYAGDKLLFKTSAVFEICVLSSTFGFFSKLRKLRSIM